MTLLVRIEMKDGLVGRILIDNGLGYLQVLKWKGWPVRAYPFRKWLLDMKAKGATFRLNGRRFEVRYHGMFRRTTQTTRCAAGCGLPIVWRGDYAAIHGPPHYHPGCRARALAPGRNTRFKKGLVPWNKGVHYTAPGSEKGWFPKGHRPATWKGGVSLNQGYRYILVDNPNDRYPSGPRRRVNESHLIAERILARSVAPHEVVVHLDGKPGNNDPLNLRVMTRSQSINHHRTNLAKGRRILPGFCPRCHVPKNGDRCRECGRTAQGYILMVRP